MELGRFRVGLRVPDVSEATHFYRGLGFSEVGTVPADDGRMLMAILQREGVMLLVDALIGMPFAPTEREHQVQSGPRGLVRQPDFVIIDVGGVGSGRRVLGLGVVGASVTI